MFHNYHSDQNKNKECPKTSVNDLISHNMNQVCAQAHSYVIHRYIEKLQVAWSTRNRAAKSVAGSRTL